MSNVRCGVWTTGDPCQPRAAGREARQYAREAGRCHPLRAAFEDWPDRSRVLVADLVQLEPVPKMFAGVRVDRLPPRLLFGRFALPPPALVGGSDPHLGDAAAQSCFRI